MGTAAQECVPAGRGEQQEHQQEHQHAAVGGPEHTRQAWRPVSIAGGGECEQRRPGLPAAQPIAREQQRTPPSA